MNSPLITIILPVYNGMKFLKESVESVLNQDLDEYEFLICDDCSTDSSYEYLSSLTDPHIKLFKNEQNRGLFPTLNRLIKSAKAPLVHLWAQDDVMYSNCLSETLKYHDKFPHINFSFSRWHAIDDKGDIIGKAFSIKDKLISPLDHAKSSILYGSIAGNIANVTVVKKAVVDAGFFNENMIYCGDFEMWYKLSKNTPVGMCAGYLIQMRRHTGQLSRNLKASYFRLTENKEVYQLFLKHFKGEQLKTAQRILKWKIYPQYFTQLLFIYQQKDKELFNQYKKELKGLSPLHRLFFRWGIIKCIYALKLDKKFFNSYVHKTF